MKQMRALLIVVGASFAMMSCTGDTGPAGPIGDPGEAGTGCTAVDNMDGTYDVTCAGTTVTVSDGAPCSIVDNLDGTKTITCDDGTTAVINDGTDVDPAVLADIQAKLDEAANVDAEACVVCHDGDGTAEHQDIYDEYVDASKLGLTIDSVVAAADPVCTTLVACADASDCDAGVACTTGVCVGQDDNICKDGSCDNLTGTDGTCSGEFFVTMTFTVSKNGGLYITTKAELLALDQRTFYVASYDTATGTFPLSQSLSRNTAAPTSTAGQYTVTAMATFDPTTNGQAYAYITEGLLDTENVNSVHLYDDVASAGMKFGTWTYTSPSDVSGCEKCHGTPYMKHGYRDPVVENLDDFSSCKSCHYDNRVGGHQDWQMLANDPARYAVLDAQAKACAAAGDGSCNSIRENMTQAELDQYAYTANLMNDVHMAHSMEFPFPQSMSTCATCHAGRLGDGTAGSGILDEANFTRSTCRGCHAVTGSNEWVSCTTIVDCDSDSDCDDGTCDNQDANGDGECVGEDDNDCADGTCDNLTAGVGVCFGEDVHGTRQTAMEQIWVEKGLAVSGLHLTTWLTDTSTVDCNVACHLTGGAATTMMKDLHNGGFDPQIYTGAGDKYSDIFVTNVVDASFNSTTNILTVDFSITEGTPAVASLDPADVVPTLMIGLYGYDARQYIVYTHGRDANRERLLEIEIDDGTNTTHPRFTVVSAANGVYQVTADLTMWAQLFTDGVVRRAEIGVMSELIMIVDADDADTSDDACTSGCLGDTHCETNACVADDDYMVALDAPSRTFDLMDDAFDDAFYPDIVDVAGGCNSCHDALATTFHSPKRGGNIRICKMCHVSSSRGSHLEMQSRGIDSYVHAVHSFQVWDTGDIDFSDPVEVVRYEHHRHHTIPTFTIKNCEACHNPGTYNVPDQSRSLSAVLSATDTVDRNIGDYPQQVVGPAANACGSCHRSQLLNHDDAGGLAAFMSHLESGGYMVEDASGVWDTIVATIMSAFE